MSVVLLLKDRPEYTKRWLDYANLSQFPFRILIADGSERSGSAENIAEKADFPNLDIEYVRYAPDRTRRHFFAKTADAVGRVTTPYLIKAANDDFFSVEGVRESVAFLEAHPKYAAARGRIADFTLDPRDVREPHQFVYGRINRWEVFKPGETSNVHSSAADRVASQCAFYVTCWHDVQRTHDVAARDAMLLACNPTDARVGDNVIDFLTIASGGVFRGTFPYMFRQSNPRTSAGRDMLGQFRQQADWVTSPSWAKDTSCLFASVGSVISARDGQSPESASATFEKEWVGVYVAKLIEGDSARPPTFKIMLKRIIRDIADALPIFNPIRRRLAAYAAKARSRQAENALAALGWTSDAEPIVRFLAAGGSR